MTGRQLERALLLARTTRNLRPSQILHRIRLRAQRFPPSSPIAAVVLERTPAGDRTVPGWPSEFTPVDLAVGEGYPGARENAAGRFLFLNEERRLGSPPDWRQPGASRLWRYHLHYFEWAWSFAGDEDREWARTAFAGLWSSWSSSVAFGRTDVWSPYVASLRAWVLCGVHAPLVTGGDVDQEVVTSLRRHAQFLRWHMEHDVGGNHLVKNIKALVGLGFFLGDDALVKVARTHLVRQLAVQVLSDGGHYERSPSYHCQVLGDFIDIAGLIAAAGRPPVPGLAGAIEAMRQWLGAMLMPDGDVPLFNDCALLGPHRLRALAPGPPASSRLTVLPASGYVIMRPDERLHLVADVGDPCPPDLPAHAHADCLSFELAVDGERLIVDSGTSTYDAGERRGFERSTPAHNTVTVDGADQTEVWGIFRAARLARASLERANDDGSTITVVASHDGYRRLPGRPVHRRTWTVTEGHVALDDEVLGVGSHRIDAHLHLGPRREALQWTFTPAVDITERSATHATGFGRLVDGRVVSASWQAELPFAFRTEIRLGPG